jgi:hypothetical protein
MRASRRVKVILAGLMAVVVVAVVYARISDANPAVTIPSVPLPSPNAYSIGPDGRDDHGTPIVAPADPGMYPPGMSAPRGWITSESRGDIVAGIDLTAAPR